MTIMEARTHILPEKVYDYIGKPLSSEGVDLYTDRARELADRIVVVGINHEEVSVIDLTNPAFADVQSDIPAAVKIGLNDPRYLVIDLSFDSLANEVQDMISDKFLDDVELTQENFNRGLEHVQVHVIIRAILRAVQGSAHFLDRYMSDSEAIRSVNNDEWSANPGAIRNITCPECFMVRSATGSCGCAD